MEQLEGRISVEAALIARQRKISLIVIRAGMHEKNVKFILDEAEAQAIPVKHATREEIDAMAKGVTHGGVIALASPKLPLTSERFLDQLKQPTNPVILLLLEGVDDEQNFGFTLRTAEAMGVHAVLLKKHLWDFDGNVVSRASSGAFERLALVQIDNADKIMPKLRLLGIRSYGCIANAKRSMYDVDLSDSVLLAIGGEKRGLSAAVRNHCDTFIHIPMLSDIGSLSLGHAASILMAEAMRQRMKETLQSN
ncbi:RNA methyltransferase [candidate division KSB1 bacterium]|nr:RNA methyltransferase [candidate division KSB1 bacterium]